MLSRKELETIWSASVRTLRDGFETGSIVTVRDGAREAPFDPAARRFVYNRERCATCGDRVVSFDINSRTAYACLNCQPLRKGVMAALPAARRKEVESASPAKLFASRCAPDEVNVALPPSKMTVAQLRAATEGCGLDPSGKKADLVSRLEKHSTAAAAAKAAAAAAKAAAAKAKAAAAAAKAAAKAKAAAAAKAAAKAAAAAKAKAAAAAKREPLDDAEDALAARLSVPSSSSSSAAAAAALATPGTAGLIPATPAAAAAEKRRAGEKGNVEHVAQTGEDLATALGPALKKKKKSALSPSSSSSSPITPAPRQQKKKIK